MPTRGEMNKDIIEKAIKEAREKKPGVIIPRDDIYNAIFKAGVETECREWLEADESTQLAKAIKAGYDKRESEFVYNPDYLDFDKGVETGKELGIRLVVEWIEEQGQETFRTGYYPSQEMWQAQKKVWLNEKV